MKPRAPAPAVGAAVCLVAGIWAGAWSVEGEGHAVALGASCLAILACLAGGRRRWLAARRAAFVAFWLAAGFLAGRASIAALAKESLEASWSLPRDRGADKIEGVLADFWSGEAPRSRARLSAARLWDGKRWRSFPGEVWIHVAGAASPQARVSKGDRVRLAGRLRREELPASTRDPALPWARWRMTVKSALQIERLGATPASLFAWPNQALFEAMPRPGERGEAFDRDVRGPLAALLLGRTSELDRGMAARFRRGGLYHLLVISGLHVVLAAALASGALRACGIHGKVHDLVLLGAIATFLAASGANPPAVRAGLFFALLIAARLLERPISGAQAAGLSAILLFAAAPKQIFSIGTVLTFAAVIGLGLYAPAFRRRLPSRPKAAREAWAAALGAEAATAPVLFWRFNMVAAGAWLTAPLAVPLSAALIVVGALLLLLFLLGMPFGAVAALFGAGCRALELLADRAAGMTFLRPTPPLAAIAAVGALTLLAALAPRRVRLPLAAAAASLFLFLAVRPGRVGPQEGFSVEALDVGQGDAILLRWGERALLVDGGGGFDLEATEFGRTRVLPKLLDRGVTRLDAVVLTHPHPDHALGLFAIVDELPVSRVWMGSGHDESGLATRLAAAAAHRGVPVEALRTGRRVAWEDASLAVLHSGGRLRKVDGINNQSLVLRFSRQGASALLTGDAGAPTERALTEEGLLAPTDLLKVGHHGSRTSTSPLLLETIRPRMALLSCGRDNRFGHPTPEVLAALERARVRLFRTDRLSDVEARLSGNGTQLSWRGIP